MNKFACESCHGGVAQPAALELRERTPSVTTPLACSLLLLWCWPCRPADGAVLCGVVSPPDADRRSGAARLVQRRHTWPFTAPSPGWGSRRHPRRRPPPPPRHQPRRRSARRRRRYRCCLRLHQQPRPLRLRPARSETRVLSSQHIRRQARYDADTPSLDVEMFALFEIPTSDQGCNLWRNWVRLPPFFSQPVAGPGRVPSSVPNAGEQRC